MKFCCWNELRSASPNVEAELWFLGHEAGTGSLRHLARTVCLLIAIATLAPTSVRAQSPTSFATPTAYDMQPGTVPAGVATGVFNNSGGLLDFAVLEQIPNSASYQVEIFHGKNDGTFCTNCGNATPNPDVVALGASGRGNAIAAGQFRSGGPLDIAVATSTGLVFLRNNGTGTFTFDTNPSDMIAKANGYAVLTVGQFNGANTSGTQDIAAVTPSVNGSVNFTVFFSNGDGTFTAPATYSVNSTWSQCTAIMPGDFQSQAKGSDLALLCNNPSEAGVLVYLNSGSGGGYTYTYSSTPYNAGAFGGVLPSAAIGTLNGLATIFVSSVSNSFATYQSNGLVGQNNAFTGVSMIPVGLAPHNPLAVLYNSPAAVDFVSGPSVSTFTSYTQRGTSVDGTWNSTPSLGPTGQALATGYSPNLTQGPAYVVIDAGVHGGSYPNFQTYVDERSISVFLVTLNADGTVATTNATPDYAGTAASGYAFPPSFATGDFNGDGIMDLAVSGADNATGDATATIYLANSNGSLPPPTSTPTSVVTVNNTFYSGTDAIAAGKFRTATQTGGKTLYDLAIFSFGQISIQTSNGDGTFTAGNSYPVSGDPNYPGFQYRSASGAPPFAPVLSAVDVNGDGISDLVLTLPEDPFNCSGSGSVSQGAVYVLISNGDGTFQNPVFVAPPVVNPVSVTAARFFGGTAPDLVFADGGELCSGNTAATTGAAVGILRNNGSGVFTPPTNSVVLSQSTDASVPNVTAVASADMNGDGLPDLVVSGTNGIQVLLNQGSGSFAPTAQGIVPLYAGDVVPGPLCPGADIYVGCVTYDSQVTTGSFFASGENDVAASVAGVVYLFQNQTNSGALLSPTQGFVAGANSYMLSAALTGSNGLSNLLVATSAGTAYLANSASPEGPPIATFIPYEYATSIDFGTVETGQTSPLEILELYNSGTGPLHLYSISLINTYSQPVQSAPFVLNSIYCNTSPGAPVSTQEPVSSLPNLTLAPGIACDFALTMQPTAGGTSFGTFNLLDNAAQTNAPDQQPNGQNYVQTIQLSGQATFPEASYSPGFITFGSVYGGTPASQVEMVTSNGTGPLTVSGISVTPLAGQSTTEGFSISQILCNGVAPSFPVMLNPGQSCAVTVAFETIFAGSYNAELSIYNNSPFNGSGNVQSLLLSATAIEDADMAVALPSLPSDYDDAGSQWPFAVEVTDNGAYQAPNVNVTFNFSAPVQFGNFSHFSCPTAPSAGSTISSFSCNIAIMGVGSSGSIVTFLNVTPFTTGTLTLTVTVSSSLPDPNLSNNSAQTSLTVITPPPAQVPPPILKSLSFQPAPGSPNSVGSGTASVATADFNGDGIPDLAVVNGNNNTVSILIGNGNGSFQPAVNYVINRNPFPTLCTTGCGSVAMSIVAASFRGNGTVDLAITNIPVNDGCKISGLLTGNTCSSVAILLGNGDGTFQQSNQISLQGQVPVYIAAEDFNGDEVPDLAVSDLNSSEIEILLSNRNGSFSEPNPPIAVGNHPVGIATGDFNDDNHGDLAVADAGDGTVDVLLGNGGGTFKAPENIYLGGRPISIVAANFTSTPNGNLDLAVADLSRSIVTILFGGGTGSFANPQTYALGGDPSSIVAGNFNGDGLMSLAVANRLTNTVSVLLNTGDGSFGSAENIPVGLSPQFLVSADFNLDNWPDIAVANAGSGSVSVLLDEHGFCAENYSGYVTVARGGLLPVYGSGTKIVTGYTQTLTLTNTSGGTINGPIELTFDSLPAGVTVMGSSTASCNSPTSPYITLSAGSLPSLTSVSVKISFNDPNKTAVTYSTRVLAGANP